MKKTDRTAQFCAPQSRTVEFCAPQSQAPQFCAPQSLTAEFCAPQAIQSTAAEIKGHPLSGRKLLFEVTEKCNLSCSSCYNKGNSACRGAEFWIRAAEKAFEIGYRHLQVIGGEPTTLPWLYHLFKHLHAQGWRDVILFSNLNRLNPELLNALSRADYKVATTIYSSDEQVHDRITGVSGSFKKTVNSIRQLQAKGVRVGISLLGASEETRHELIAMFGTDIPISSFPLVTANTPQACAEVYNCEKCNGLEVLNGSGMRGCIFGLPKKVDSPLLAYLKGHFHGLEDLAARVN